MEGLYTIWLDLDLDLATLGVESSCHEGRMMASAAKIALPHGPVFRCFTAESLNLLSAVLDEDTLKRNNEENRAIKCVLIQNRAE